MIGKMAIAIALAGFIFNDLGSSDTPTFLSMGHFLHGFSTLSGKKKEIYRLDG